ncbi:MULTISPECIES: ubiquinol-cytochrome c reductase iron-sulfur subunit [Massilia]|jgi:ubiquinol-cytochrome c reductase iron-sulfur subunit|uniref:Ubiquinol-cytochrome c reductase iron-sulfur subunit n=2 Tax=Massilia TaxID=149698 RepID=A0A422QLZ7_9BURK|nr:MULTISPECIES: ubiquinol-cytochrome c reductase iron-sulfur subunit [Massilia]MDY0963453.1 ubiquinol-cytochrome c reductase iron-sulfur subunit [Massilia sp. CFBP9026]RNF31039.1 ubiquinol-cytochrome C reductase [Massilia aurea]TXF99386.1 ubiquinol-cytochrome c reductase iron-sulfur subunit [Massilia arenae]
MSNEKQVDPGRRGLLVATCAAGGVVGVSTAGALVSTFQPSERAKAAGAPVEVDISDVAPGEMKVVEWRGKPVWILRRTPEMMATLEKDQGELADPASDKVFQLPMPEYAKNAFRSRAEHKEVLVTVGICSHLGCSPSSRLASGPQPNLPDNWPGGFLCPCHGSTFDLSARVFKNKPAPTNMDVPPYMYLSDNKLVIGKDEKGEA